MEEQRQDCPFCNDTRQRYYTRQTPTGVVGFCHNCGKTTFESNGTRSNKQLLEVVRQYSSKDTTENTVRDIKLPYDFSLTIPTQAQLWLKKYGITDEEIETFGFGWSDSYQRLILPVFSESGKLIYYQGRTFKPLTKDNPKYLNIRQSGASNVFFIRNSFQCDQSLGLYVVEDILSCVKVGRYAPCLALLGSYFPKSIYPLYRLFPSVSIWLDNDKYTTAIKHAKVASTLTGLPFRVVNTKEDPKELSDIALKRTIYPVETTN